MENISAVRLGPRPAEPVPVPRPGRARSLVLAAVREEADRSRTGVPLTRLAAATGLHVNTLREHLEGLLADGLVERKTGPRAGRGRPAWLYRPAQPPADPVAEYAGLATALAAAIHRSSPRPVEDAVAAGTDWGRELARATGRPASPGAEPARRQVVEVLAGMGFDPATDADATDVRLARCPLLEAAERYPDVVCGVHLGIARGALAEFGADPSGTEMLPFAEPGACLLRLPEQPVETRGGR